MRSHWRLRWFVVYGKALDQVAIKSPLLLWVDNKGCRSYGIG